MSALAAVGTSVAAAGALAAPREIAELSLHGLPSHPKWLPAERPLFGKYLASGGGEASGALSGRVFWDLYEDQTLVDRHPSFFRGFIEREGRRYRFEIIGIYTPEAVDARRWRISGAITFADEAVLGTKQQPMTGTFEASTRTSRFTIWADQ